MPSVNVPSSVAMTWGDDPGRQAQSRMAVLKDVDRRFRPDAVLWSDLIGFSVKGVPNGAIGNGIADDSESILAKNTAAAAANGGYIFFPPGTYRISTNLTIGSSTIQPRFAPGASLSIDPGVTVTMPIPDAGDYQIISGSGSVSFSGGPTGTYNPKWFGVLTTATGVNNTTAFNKLFSALPEGAHVFLGEGTYIFVGTPTISKACIFEGTGPKTILSFESPDEHQNLLINVSDVSVEHLWIRGPQGMPFTWVQEQIGLYANGTVGNNVSNIKAIGLRVSDWCDSGIQLRFCNKFHVQNCEVYSCFNGIILLQASYGVISHSYIHDIIGDGDLGTEVYGISITKNNGTESSHPASHDIDVTGNTIENVRTWEGIGTHGGRNINIRGNKVYDCIAGIALGSYVATEGEQMAPTRCIVEGNIIHNNHSGTSDEKVLSANQKYAILITGYFDTIPGLQRLAEGNVIANNTIEGWGTTGSRDIGDAQAAIELQYNNGTIVRGNTLINNGFIGIGFFSCLNLKISDNVIDTVVGTLAGQAGGTVKFAAEPIVGQRLRFNRAIFTFTDVESAGYGIQVMGTLVSTLAEIVSVLNGHLDGRVSIATYSTDGINRLEILFDTIGTFGSRSSFGASNASTYGSPSVFTAPTGTITYGSLPIDGDTITMNGVVFTYRDATSAERDIEIGDDVPITIDNTRLKLTASTDTSVNVATYTDDDDTILTIIHDGIGNAGDAYTLSRVGDAMEVSGGNLVSVLQARGTIWFDDEPTADDTIEMNGITFTFITGSSTDTDIEIKEGLEDTLAEAVTVLNGSDDDDVKKATYSSNGTDTLTIDAIAMGAVGEDFTLAASPDTVSGSTLIQDFTPLLTQREADGEIVFDDPPLAADTIEMNGTTFTFITGLSTDTDIEIQVTISLTLIEAVAVLNGSDDPDVSVATYTYLLNDDGAHTIGIKYNTVTSFGETFTLVASEATASGATLTQTAVVFGSCAIHNKNLSEGPDSTGLISGNIFNIGAYTGIQMESDALGVFVSDNQHLGTGPLADCDGSGVTPQNAVRRIDHLGDIMFKQELPSIDDGTTHIIYVPMPSMAPNSSIVVTPNLSLGGLVMDVVPQTNYFEVFLANQTGSTVDLLETTFVCYVNHNILPIITL